MSEGVLRPGAPIPQLRAADENPALARLRYGLRLIARDKGAVLGLFLFGLLIVSAVFAEQLAPHDPLQQNLRNARLPPAWTEGGTWRHVLGTDNLGRDLFSRIIYGSRVSLTVGLFGVLIAAGLGLIVGMVAGYVGGRLDRVTMTVINIIMALPYLLFVVFIAGVFGRSLLNVILIFGLTNAPIFARVARGEVLRIKSSGYVESAISIGARPRHIIFNHILPNLIGPLLTVATFEMSAMIFYEASLSFLGLSVPPSIPSWGNMLEAGRPYLQSLPWIATFPGLAIMLTSLGMNLLGDWLRDVLDPRLRRARK